MSEKNYTSIAWAIVISVGLIVAAAVVVSVISSTPSNNSNYNPSYNNNYNTPTPTPTPTPKPEFRIYNLDGAWNSYKVSTGILSSKTVYDYRCWATVTNYGNADGFVTLQGYAKQGITTHEYEQTLYLKAGETQNVYFTFENLQNEKVTYNIIRVR